VPLKQQKTTSSKKKKRGVRDNREFG